MSEALTADAAICPICLTGRPRHVELRRSVSGRIARISVCSECLVFSNTSAEDDADLQAEGSRSVYGLGEEEVRELPRLLGQQAALVRSLLPEGWTRLDDRVFLEFGAGRGLMPVAARHLGFRAAYGVDLNLETFEQVRRHLPVPPGVALYKTLDAVPEKADLVVMWHTLEHIPQPRALLAEIAAAMRPGGRLVIQVPQYRREYVCETHHFFYTEPSLERLLAESGFADVRFTYDTDLEFLTAWVCRAA